MSHYDELSSSLLAYLHKHRTGMSLEQITLAHRGKARRAIFVRLTRLRAAELVEMHVKSEGGGKAHLWYPPGVWERKNKSDMPNARKPVLPTPTGVADADVRTLLKSVAGVAVSPARLPTKWAPALHQAWRRGYVAKVPVPFRWILTPLGAEQIGYAGPLEEGGE